MRAPYSTLPSGREYTRRRGQYSDPMVTIALCIDRLGTAYNSVHELVVVGHHSAFRDLVSTRWPFAEVQSPLGAMRTNLVAQGVRYDKRGEPEAVAYRTETSVPVSLVQLAVVLSQRDPNQGRESVISLGFLC